MSKFVCTVCGYVYEGESLPADFTCPICKAPASKFQEQKGDMTWAAEHVVGVAQGVDPEILQGLRDNCLLYTSRNMKGIRSNFPAFLVCFPMKM